MISFDSLLIIFTLIVCIILLINIKIKNILTFDGMFSFIGFIFGIFMTFMNKVYFSWELLFLSPVIAISCLIYLRFRDQIFNTQLEIFSGNNNESSRKLRIVNIFYWVLIFLSLYIFSQSSLYSRPLTFFVIVTFGVVVIGANILLSNLNIRTNVYFMIFKILLLSLILRSSAYFGSPYPLGGDSWAHVEYVKNFALSSSLTVGYYPNETMVNSYYLSYPLMHLFVVFVNKISNFSIEESMFFIGFFLVLSTIFLYLLTKELTENETVALFSILLLNFSDCHIEWSWYITPMTFGLTFYTIIIYLFVKKNTALNHLPIYNLLILIFMFSITWTHTIATFITLISIFCLFIGPYLYNTFSKQNLMTRTISATFCIVSSVIVISHWFDPNYSFLEGILIGITNALSEDHDFLSTISNTNLKGNYIDIFLNLVGFLSYALFGIIGTLSYLSRNKSKSIIFSLIFVVSSLFLLRYSFPLFGLKIILPARWPVFIYIIFVFFVSVGLFKLVVVINNKKHIALFILLFLFFSSFFMITNQVSNVDSPIYGKDLNMKYLWKESEMALYGNINEKYDGLLVTDVQTGIRPFKTYFRRENVTYYKLDKSGRLDWNYLEHKLIIWSKDSLERPVPVGGYDATLYRLGFPFKTKLDENYNLIYDTGESRAYL